MKKLLPVFVFFVALMSSFSSAQTSGGIEEELSKAWYEEELFIFNVASASKNPSYIKDIPYADLNDIRITYGNQDGRFRPFDAGLNSRILEADIYGIHKLNKATFEGRLNYTNDFQEDMRWNGTTMTSPLNPFLMADTLRYDSITNDSRRESFKLYGGMAIPVNDFLTFGVSAIYHVSSKADQSDPRLKANAARTTFIPGLTMAVSNSLSLGFSALVELYHENIVSSIEDNMIGEHCKVYIYKALGDFDGRDALGYSRRYDGRKYGVMLQSSVQGDRLCNYTEASFTSNVENAVDGGTSYRRQGGDFGQTTLTFHDRFSIRHGSVRHNVMFNANMDICRGKWYNQREDRDDVWNKVYFKTISTELIHKQSNLKAAMEYRFDVLKSNQPNISASLNAGFRQVNVTQYPDENHADYSMFNTGLKLAKWVDAGKVHLKMHADAGMDYALKSLDLAIELSDNAHRRFYNGYYQPKYAYLSADDWYAGLGLSALYPVFSSGRASWIGLSMGLSMVSYIGAADIFESTDRKTIQASVSYTF